MRLLRLQPQFFKLELDPRNDIKRYMALNKFKKLKVKQGAKSSRFVVDLKLDLAAAETKIIKNKKSLITESKLEKLAELDYGKILKAGSKNARKNFLAGAKTVCNRNFWLACLPASQACLIEPGSAKAALKRDSLAGKFRRELDQLAFVALVLFVFAVMKRIIIFIQKICYYIGWLIVFCSRLAYFVLLAVISPIIKSLSFVTSRLRPAMVDGLKIFFSGFKAKKFRPFMAADGSPRSRRLIPRLESEKEIIPAAPLYYRGAIGYLKPVLAFAGVLLIMILPVKGYTYYKTIDSAKGRVLGASESAMNDLISGGQAAADLDFNQADENFSRASTNFLIAKSELGEINDLLFTLGSIAPLKNIQLAAAGKHLVAAGALSAEAGKNLSLAVKSLFDYQASDGGSMLSDLSLYGHRAVTNLTDLSQELNQINSQAIPEDYQKNFILLKQKTGELANGLGEFISLADKMKSFLGGGSAKRYLLVFQNNSELRASGGFIGSFALVDFLGGKIKNIEAPGGGSYDTDAGLLKKIKSPEPLRLVRPDWHFWDANWWPDWPTSAKKLAWFYENSDGPTVDGVIGLTPTVMEEILKIIGPIDLTEKYGVIINADNFWAVTQEFAEQKPNITKQPKKIIGDLMNKVIEELPKRLNKNNFLPMLKAVEKSLSDKNILFYFTDDELRAGIEELGWDGKIKPTAGDYLSVINTNIAGGKSDRKIKQAIIHQAEILPDGSIIDNLTIKRVHEGLRGERFSGVRNVDWLRVYVPQGSELIEAEGFRPVDKIFFKVAEASWADDPEVMASEGQAEAPGPGGTKVYNELGKTVFANWSQLDPGETVEIKIKYKLPFKATDKKLNPEQGFLDRLLTKTNQLINPEQKDFYLYSLVAQKQPGMNSSTLESQLKLSDNLKPIWRYPAASTAGSDSFIKENFDQDKIMAAMVEEK